MAIAYCNQADFEIALGGAKVLLELADPNRTGTPDLNIVTDYLESGAAEIRSYLEIKHDPETIANLDTDSLRLLRDANASLSARIAYEKGALGKGLPEFVASRAERTDRFMQQLAIGERRLGRVAGGTAATINQPASSVDYDPQAAGISVNAFRGGFR